MAAYVATIGFFDGVHLGHQHLLRQVVAEAERRGVGAMAVTFKQHPRRTLHADWQPRLLCTLDDKRQAILDCGITRCEVLDFTPDMARLTSAEFLRTWLAARLGVRVLLIGYDHHFGADVQSGFSDYRRAGAAVGIDVLRAERFSLSGLTVSSSAIRRSLDAGDVEGAAACLGRLYSLPGRVGEGLRVGRTLGFPTANLVPEDPYLLIPARGAYAAYAVTADGLRHPAMVGIGRRPTFGRHNGLTIEAHLLGFSADLYGQSLSLHFVRRLREEHTFPNPAALVSQLRRDAQAAQEALGLPL